MSDEHSKRRRGLVAAGPGAMVGDVPADGAVTGPTNGKAGAPLSMLSAAQQEVLRQLTRKKFQWKLYPRLMYDINYKEWLYAAKCTFIQCPPAIASRDEIARRWLPTAPDNVMVTLSVRTAFDLLLRALALPEGSEVLCSGISLPNLVDIMKYHRLVLRSFDIDIVTFSADVDHCRRLVSPKTKILLCAPLFGRPMGNMNHLKKIAADNGLLFVLDGAQSFPLKHIVEELDPDVSLFSFGSIKFTTAFGGAVAVVKDPVIRGQMAEMESKLPLRPYAHFAKAIALYAFMIAVDDPLSFGIAAHLLRLCGMHVGEVVNKLSRGFPGEDIVALIRYSPQPALLALLSYRLSRVDEKLMLRRSQSGWHILSQLPPYVQVPAAGDPRKPQESTFWLFAMSVADPESCFNIFQAHGYDSAIGTSQLRSLATDGSTPQCAQFMSHILYLPVYPEISDDERRRLISLIHRIPRELIQSPSEAFHKHVANSSERHAYRSDEVRHLLSSRPKFGEPSSSLLRLISTVSMAIGVAAKL